MPNCCTVCTTTTNGRQATGISFFAYPKDPLRRRKWLTAVGREDLIDVQGDFIICEQHFEKKFILFSIGRTKKKLSADAVPSINIPSNVSAIKIEDLKYCRACLVSNVKMYSLDITSDDSIGFVYSDLTQIRTWGSNQFVCFECKGLLRKYKLFKSKCIRADDILANITINSMNITKRMLQDIDREENNLESSLSLSSIDTFYYGTKKYPYNDIDKPCLTSSETSDIYNIIYVIDDVNDKVSEIINIESNEVDEFKKKEIKIEITNDETDEHCHINSETSDMINKNYIINEENERLSEIIKTKSKEPKTKESKIKDTILFTEIVDSDDSLSNFNYNDSHSEFNDNNSEENEKETFPPKRKTNVVKDCKTKKKKTKTSLNSDDNLADNEPLSKTPEKNPLCERNVKLDFKFFEGYGTIEFLTPDDARKDLLSRKESSNYKRSLYKCEFCYKGYLTKDTYENHMKKHNPEIGKYECDLCHLRFSLYIHYCHHRVRSHKRKFTCKLCPYVCYNIDQARKHVNMHKGKKYTCDVCKKTFSMSHTLIKHKSVKHRIESDPEYVCDICGNTFGSPKGLFVHTMKIHPTDKNTKQGPKCEECNVHFSSEVAWKRHLVMSVKHSVSNGCKDCGERFPTTEDLKWHKQTVHQSIKPKYKSYHKGPTACTVCDKSFSEKREYNYHVRTEHPHLVEKNRLNKKKYNNHFVCEICGKGFTHQCHLKEHLRRHTESRPYACAQCAERFKTGATLAAHRSVKHGVPAPYKCDLCSKVFPYPTSLKKHKMTTHLRILPHKCTICGKAFLHLCEVRLHTKYVHDKVPWPSRIRKRKVAKDNKTDLKD